MAIKISGTTVINDSREVKNITNSFLFTIYDSDGTTPIIKFTALDSSV